MEDDLSSDGNSPTIVTRFRKYPELGLAFVKIGMTPARHGKYRCLGCKKVKITNHGIRLMKHASKCYKLDEEVWTLLQDKLTSATNINLDLGSTGKTDDELNTLFTSMVVANNLSLNIVDNLWFKKFISKLNPKWKIPPSIELTGIYLQHLSKKLTEHFMNALAGAENFTFSIEFDHWSDATRRSLLAIVATMEGGKRFLLYLEDVSSKGHSADAIAGSLIDALSNINTKKLNSLVSDSASSCRAAR